MTSAPYSIGADQTLDAAAHKMDELLIRHLPVLSGGELVGIVTERDIALVESLPNVDPAQVQVSEAMTSEPYTVETTTALREAVLEMAEHRYGAALVTENGQLKGLFTTTDALKALGDLLGK